MRNGSGRMAGNLDESSYITGLGNKPGVTALQENMSSVWDTDFQVPWGNVESHLWAFGVGFAAWHVGADEVSREFLRSISLPRECVM